MCGVRSERNRAERVGSRLRARRNLQGLSFDVHFCVWCSSSAWERVALTASVRWQFTVRAVISYASSTVSRLPSKCGTWASSTDSIVWARPKALRRFRSRVCFEPRCRPLARSVRSEVEIGKRSLVQSRAWRSPSPTVRERVPAKECLGSQPPHLWHGPGHALGVALGHPPPPQLAGGAGCDF